MNQLPNFLSSRPNLPHYGDLRGIKLIFLIHPLVMTYGKGEAYINFQDSKKSVVHTILGVLLK